MTTERVPDPIFAVIEKHRLADAAYDNSLERGVDKSVKGELSDLEVAALIALLRTKPASLRGCLAALRYVADWAETNDAGLFHDWIGPLRLAGAEFLPMIGDAIEAAGR